MSIFCLLVSVITGTRCTTMCTSPSSVDHRIQVMLNLHTYFLFHYDFFRRAYVTVSIFSHVWYDRFDNMRDSSFLLDITVSFDSYLRVIPQFKNALGVYVFIWQLLLDTILTQTSTRCHRRLNQIYIRTATLFRLSITTLLHYSHRCHSCHPPLLQTTTAYSTKTVA